MKLFNTGNLKALWRRSLWLALVFALIVPVAHGGEFRLSFLDEATALEDTCRPFENSGVSRDTISTFKALVTHHNKVARRVDGSRLPERQRGFYPFKSIGDLTNRLEGPLSRSVAPGTENSRTLMCFDFASFLLSGAGYDTSRLEREFIGSGIVLPIPGGPVRAPKYALFRDAYSHALCPEADFARLAGRPRTQAETQLALSLIAPHLLEGTQADGEKNIRAALQTYFRAMKQFGFRYGGAIQIGLVSYADFKGHFLAADHAFVCIQHKEGLVCLEKTNSQGPYVRTDFHSEEDLARYEASTYLDYPRVARQMGYGCPIIVTLGNRIVSIFERPSDIRRPSRAEP